MKTKKPILYLFVILLISLSSVSAFSLNSFTQPDTIIQNIYDPQNLNRYSFERNNPYKYTDPTGKLTCDALKGCIDFGIPSVPLINAQFDEGDIITNNLKTIEQVEYSDIHHENTWFADLLFFIVGGANSPGFSSGRSLPNSNKKTTDKSIVIGETQSRVDAYAEKIGAETYKTRGARKPLDQAIKNNRAWLNNKLREGYTVYDIGLHEGRVSRGNFYSAEQQVIQRWKNAGKTINHIEVSLE